MNLYYTEFGGGLGDVFHQIYSRPDYRALRYLTDRDKCRVSIISHNPAVAELFAHHPQKGSLEVKSYPYWTPAEDDSKRKFYQLPPYNFLPLQRLPHDVPPGAVFFGSPDDTKMLDYLRTHATVNRKPIVVFAVSAGQPDRSIPYAIADELAAAVSQAGYTPVAVGRTYEREGRSEYLPSGCLDLIDHLSVPGVAHLVAHMAVGVVTCHSAINILAWHERKPQLLLYPKSVEKRHFQKPDIWSFGAQFEETTHGLVENWPKTGAAMTARFLEALKG